MKAPLLISDKFEEPSTSIVMSPFTCPSLTALVQLLSDFTVISLPLCPGSTISTVFSGEVAVQQLLLVENVEINRERKVRPTKQ